MMRQIVNGIRGLKFFVEVKRDFYLIPDRMGHRPLSPALDP
jgi:hypothetical protein